MKRSDLVVGVHLYYSTHADWKHGSGIRNSHVVVRAVEPYARMGFNFREVHEVRKGTGVLVSSVLDDGMVSDHRYVVQLAHLRGPYEAAVALVERQRQEDLKRDQQRDETRAAVQDYVRLIVERARDLGVETARSATWDIERIELAKVSMRAVDLEKLLDRLSRAERNTQAITRAHQKGAS